jgi:hypothetical protein
LILSAGPCTWPTPRPARRASRWALPRPKVLADIPKVAGNPFVSPGERQGSHWVNVERSWRRIRRAAGMPELRRHDLRHSYASIGAAAGLGLPVIGVRGAFRWLAPHFLRLAACGLPTIKAR